MMTATDAVETSAETALNQALAALRNRGSSLDADAIVEYRNWFTSRSATVAVVGEVSRGKSSVVNALIADPTFAPVGEDETTTVSLSFCPPTERLPAGSIHLEFPGGEQAISREELSDWVTANGTYTGTDVGAALLGVSAGHHSPGLPGVIVVDTPGAGGLSEIHARRAVVTAERAAILLAVTDASGRLSAPAIHFLESCTKFTRAVIVVVNKIDRNRSGWEKVLDDNRAAIASHLAANPEVRFPHVEFVGVSALFALKGITTGDNRWTEQSRFPELQSVITNILEGVDRYALATALTQAIQVLNRMSERLRQEEQAASGTDDVIDDLNRHRSRVAELSKKMNRYQHHISQQLTHLQLEVEGELSERLRMLDDQWRAWLGKKITGMSKADFANAQSSIVAELDTISSEIQQTLEERVSSIIKSMFESADLDIPVALIDGPETEDPSPLNIRGATGTDLRSIGFLLMGSNLGRAASAPLSGFMDRALGGGLGGGFSSVMSLAGIGVGLMFGGRIQKRQALLDGLPRASAELKEHFRRNLTRSVSAVRDGAVLEFKDAIDEEVERLNKLMADARAAKQQSDEERRKAKANLTNERRVLDGLLKATERELARLTPTGNQMGITRL
ncbi:GTPase Era involved in 16S rRNA processing [Arthrobacter sp. W4I7]|nr:GTPase Era involved in 16S rRNA processing [Arthrobacter sp. W4I7]